MYFDDHAPPHFHASYSGSEVLIAIRDLSVIGGNMPPRAMGLVVEWAAEHQQELLENWERGAHGEPFNAIEPLK